MEMGNTFISLNNRHLNFRALLVSLFALALLITLPQSVAATEGPLYHMVEEGDTVYDLSRDYGVPRDDIVRLNRLQNNVIYVGQKLILREEKSSAEEAEVMPSGYEEGEDVAPAENETPEPETRVVAPVPAPFVLDVRNADLRDVLSALALRLGKTVILLDDPGVDPPRVTFYMEGATPAVAMKLLLQREGYDYLEEGELILVGRPDRLQSDFLDQMVLSRFNLQYIGVDTMLEALDQFGVQPRTFTVETNPRAFWAQGTPREIGRAGEVVAALDRPENIDMVSKAPMERFTLQYIAADTLKEFITQLDILDVDLHFITLPVNPQVFWVQSTPHELDRLKNLIASLDRPENTGFDLKLNMERFNLSYVPVGRMEQFLVEAGVTEEYIRIEENLQSIWVYGSPQDLEIARGLVAALDRPENAELLPQMFIYSLRSISAEYAEERLLTMRDTMEILPPSVQIMNFSFPGLSQELLIVCPPHLQEQVYNVLGQLDEPRQRIRRPVDTATGANARNELMAKRELLAQLTGIPISRMHISGNLSGDSANPQHLLWVEDTPDKIQQVMDMLEIIRGLN